MRESVSRLLVIVLLFGGLAAPCSCIDCTCAQKVAAEASDSQPEPSSCCQSSAKPALDAPRPPSAPEPKTCDAGEGRPCGEKACACGGDGSKEKQSTVPHSSSAETVSLILFAASLPPSTFEIPVTHHIERFASARTNQFLDSGLPIYLSTHSILC